MTRPTMTPDEMVPLLHDAARHLEAEHDSHAAALRSAADNVSLWGSSWEALAHLVPAVESVLVHLVAAIVDENAKGAVDELAVALRRAHRVIG